MSMCVLHVVETLTPEAGSVGVLLPGLFDALRLRGIESEVVTAEGAHARKPQHAIAQLVEKHDLVHVHGWGTDLARWAVKSACKADRPYVISPHGSLCEGPYNKWGWKDKLRRLTGENRLIRRATALTALNEQEERGLKDHKAHRNVRLLPYGVGFTEYETSGREQATLPDPLEGRCLLVLGPIHPIEGFVPLLKTFAEIGRDADGWHVMLAGRTTGEYRKMLEAAVRRKGGVERVGFAPAPDVATQRAWLSRASVLAAPCLHIRCPVSIMQAVAAGVPIIATHPVTPPGLADAIQACSPNRQELKQALRSMLNLADDRRVTMAQEARDTARATLDWPVLAERYAQLYTDLA